MKYNKERFRDRALGTQRFQGAAGPPQFRRRLSLRQSNRLIIITVPFLIAGALFGQRIAGSLAKHEFIEGRVVAKELRTLENAEEVYAVFVEAVPPAGEGADEAPPAIHGGLAVEPALWHTLQMDDPVRIEYTPPRKTRPLRIYSIQPSPPADVKNP